MLGAGLIRSAVEEGAGGIRELILGPAEAAGSVPIPSILQAAPGPC